MEGTTILVSKKFHDLLKSRGKKGESYEEIIRKMLKPEFLRDFSNFKYPFAEPKEPSLKPKAALQKAKPIVKASPPLELKDEPKKKEALKLQKRNIPAGKAKILTTKKVLNKTVKKLWKQKNKALKSARMPSSAQRKSPSKQTIGTKDELGQLRYMKNLELQRLNTELELAKLSNNTTKINELGSQIAKLREELTLK